MNASRGAPGWDPDDDGTAQRPPVDYEAAISALNDPLNDPLPEAYTSGGGNRGAGDSGYDPWEPEPEPGAGPSGDRPATGRRRRPAGAQPGARPFPQPGGADALAGPTGPAAAPGAPVHPGAPAGQDVRRPGRHRSADRPSVDVPGANAPSYGGQPSPQSAFAPPGAPVRPGAPNGAQHAAHDPQTVGLRRVAGDPVPRPPHARTAPTGAGPSATAPPSGPDDATAVIEAVPAADPVPATDGPVADPVAPIADPIAQPVPAPGTSTTSETAPATGGRAARRKAERERKATRANKIANVFGELMITTGALMMLFVTYQLWWTNVEARAHANSQADALLDEWDSAPGGSGDGDGAATDGDADSDEPPDTSPGVFSPGDGFALLYLPTLDVRVPIAEGVDPASVLDRGMVGRYSEEDGLPTAMPWDDEGNVGLAAHRNTHGEPFRYINRLNPGDPIIVETESTYFVYETRSRLDSTSPSNIQVLDPVPAESGFTEPGRYITLTTCTPEFTSTFRLIVWGELVAEQPRSEGKPDALVT
ncbi:class E sortase [Streptomyces otsuchiensis]|uniref:class E sortase n=1 Tax=Streptomyces otsuchiensis TaxID=2681388 RepID=UPI001D131E94|nr:class E sortase [Streptomyces otsuchiensis]